MSKLEELIQKLCTKGVVYKRLGETCKIETGKLNANSAVNGGEYAFFTTAKEVSRIDTYRWDTEALLIAGNANVGDVKHYVGKFEAYQRTYVLTEFDKNINVRFLYYSLCNNLKTYLSMNKNEAAMTYIVLGTLENFMIPVPPIEVQHEIVRILDNFTELTAELTAELTTRKKQYEFYRTNILSVHGERIPLTNICDICTGSSNTEDAEVDGQYNFYVRSQELLKKNSYEYDDVSIITAGDGVGVGKVFHLTNGKYALHQRAYRIHPVNSKVNCKYLFYFFITFFPPYILSIMYEGSVPSIRRPMLNNFEVLIPTLKEQQRIVDILDKFDAYCNDLSLGLPAEIAARQKQYEYYRDKLLTFKELKA